LRRPGTFNEVSGTEQPTRHAPPAATTIESGIMATNSIRALVPALLLATLLAGSAGASAREITRKGPYFILAPYTQAIHMDMEYLLTDYQTRTSSSEWRAFWRFGFGWAFSQKVSLGVDFGSTGEGLYDEHHEYDTSVLRLNWFPTGGAWYVTGGGGIGSADAPLNWTPGYEYGTVYDASWLVTIGAGYEFPIWRNLALQGQVDWLQQRAHQHEGQSGYWIDVDSWIVGMTLIWYP